jgi:hypothetical protein
MQKQKALKESDCDCTRYISYWQSLANILNTQPRDSDSGYNELMNCQVKDELVSQLIALNSKLNLLSPDLVHGDKERAEVQERRESLYAEIKHHRAKGHEGKPCPAARRV